MGSNCQVFLYNSKYRESYLIMTDKKLIRNSTAEFLIFTAKGGDDPILAGKNLYGVKDDFELECAERLSLLEDQEFICLHIRRTDYPDLYDGLTNHVEDPDDIEVVLDAHDLSVLVPKLIFWTGDGAHIVKNRDVILNLTSLSDLRYLGDRSLE
ncbi:MAG: hypothetical protein PHV39_08115 [Methanomicrobium sp.]|nr:hypothetical protein [Methanomicrobium sp.]